MTWKRADDRRAYHRKYMRERREWLKSHHMCTECKRQDAFTLAGKAYCAECTQRDRQRKGRPPIDWAEEKAKALKTCGCTREERIQRGDRGQCYVCGKPVKEGVSNWTGKPFRVCERHYAAAVKGLKKATENYKKAHNGLHWGQVCWNLRHNRHNKSRAGNE